MVEWPDLEELKQVLDIRSDDWDGSDVSADQITRLTRLLLAAVEKVKMDVAGSVAAFDEAYTEPTAGQSQAALRMAELLALRPEVAAGVVTDPTYNRLLYGTRLQFGIA